MCSCFKCLLGLPSQVGGDGTSLHPQAAPPATGTGVVGLQPGGSVAGVLGLDGGIRVGEGAAVIQPHWGADPLCWRCGGTGKGGRLGPQCS